MTRETENELQELLERHTAFWKCADVDRPLLWTGSYVEWSGAGPYYLRDGSTMTDGMRVEPGIVDLDSTIRISATQRQPTSDLQRKIADFERSVGEGRPVSLVEGDYILPWDAPPWPWMEAILGCPVYYQMGSFWAAPLETDWDQVAESGGWEDSPWLEELFTVRRLLLELTAGEIAVCLPLFRGPFDMAVAAMGSAEFCMAAMDRPDALVRFISYCTDLYLDVARRWYEEIPAFHGAYFLEGDWGLMAPAVAIRFQSDSSYLISPRMYRELLLPLDRRVAQAFEYSAMATHTSQANHWSVYAEIPELDMIEVCLEAPPFGRPPLGLLPQFRGVQEGGKALLLHGAVTQCEADGLREGLSPTGLALRFRIRE